MSTRRRATSPSPSPVEADSRSPSPARRQAREVRISAGPSASGRGSAIKLSASRTRRPTPVARRSRVGRLSEVLPHDHDDGHDDHDDRRRHHRHHPDESASDDDEHDSPDHDHRHGQETSRRQVSINTESVPNGRGGRTRQLTLASNTPNGSRTALDGSPLSWYERMMPECLLNMTSPITGYERELERRGELGEYELEILERERVRRNRRVRRRLAFMLLALGAASAFFIYRGRMPGRRPPGVRGAITAMTSRLEDGLSKTIHDTMGK